MFCSMMACSWLYVLVPEMDTCCVPLALLLRRRLSIVCGDVMCCRVTVTYFYIAHSVYNEMLSNFKMTILPRDEAAG